MNEKLRKVLTDASSGNSDIWKETEVAARILLAGGYPGYDEDLQYLEDVKDCIELENLLSRGSWYFQETDTWKSYKTTNTKWQEILEHARYFAEHDYLEGIKPGSWEGKNATRELEDHLRMNSIWSRYKETDEEYDVLKFFVEEYNKELEKLWNEA